MLAASAAPCSWPVTQPSHSAARTLTLGPSLTSLVILKRPLAVETTHCGFFLRKPPRLCLEYRPAGSHAAKCQLSIAYLIGFSKPQKFVEVQRAPSSFHMLPSNPWFMSRADINGFMLKLSDSIVEA
jgi:hypothetical protein